MLIFPPGQFTAKLEKLTTDSRYDVPALLALHDEATALVHPNHHVLCELAKGPYLNDVHWISNLILELIYNLSLIF